MNAPLEATAPEPDDLTPADAFAAWVLYGRPGDVCVYHHGLLVVDRDPVVSRLSATARQALAAVADLALAFAEAGRVLLVQERLGDRVYRYLAVIAARQKQAAKPMSRPIVLIPQVCIGAMAAAVEELA
ncbi:MAG: hypothetical protein P9C36_02610 [Defluviicoccus sp.]|nr:hypothetical protein [Defluviicoccus sp.]MDG4591500.1 hypothetical protein [Defluviicoccus sp.]